MQLQGLYNRGGLVPTHQLLTKLDKPINPSVKNPLLYTILVVILIVIHNRRLCRYPFKPRVHSFQANLVRKNGAIKP